MKDVIRSVREALVEQEKNAFEMPLRSALGDASALIMPVLHKQSGLLMTKILSLDVEREPFINGIVAWAGRGVSQPFSADAATITAMRTGAVTGVAADHFARDDATSLVVFGAGAQAMDQIRAICAVRTITRVTIAARTAARLDTISRLVRQEFPDIAVEVTTDGRRSLAHADIVVCATTSREALFDADDIADTTFVAAIGSYRPDMRELPAGLLHCGRPIVVDNLEACVNEAGEICHAIAAGDLAVSDLVTLGAALTQPKDKGKAAVFKSVGVATLDWAATHVLSEKLDWQERQIG